MLTTSSAVSRAAAIIPSSAGLRTASRMLQMAAVRQRKGGPLPSEVGVAGASAAALVVAAAALVVAAAHHLRHESRDRAVVLEVVGERAVRLEVEVVAVAEARLHLVVVEVEGRDQAQQDRVDSALDSRDDTPQQQSMFAFTNGRLLSMAI